jgi:cellulose synthase/poly-beta-1,6-N-acetylglucosamine synthase-like glycosyltransferase
VANESISMEDFVGSHPTDVQLSVIAPTYNESENLEALISAVDSSLQEINYEIVISDDDSPDRTWARAEEVGRLNSHVRVLRRIAIGGWDRRLSMDSVMPGARRSPASTQTCSTIPVFCRKC